MIDDDATVTETRPATSSWIILAIVGVVIFLIGVTLGVLSRHPGVVRVGPTATVTVAAPSGVVAPVASQPVSQTQFGDGVYQVGVDIAPGNYHTDGGKNCYWERLSNLSGGFTGIISNGEPTGPTTVRVMSSDKGFGVHGGCTWTAVN